MHTCIPLKEELYMHDTTGSTYWCSRVLKNGAIVALHLTRYTCEMFPVSYTDSLKHTLVPCTGWPNIVSLALWLLTVTMSEDLHIVVSGGSGVDVETMC